MEREEIINHTQHYIRNNIIDAKTQYCLKILITEYKNKK